MPHGDLIRLTLLAMFALAALTVGSPIPAGIIPPYYYR